MYEGFRFINSIRKKSVNVVSKIFQRERTNYQDTYILLIDVGIISHDIVKIKWFFKREREREKRDLEEEKK